MTVVLNFVYFPTEEKEYERVILNSEVNLETQINILNTSINTSCFQG